MNPFTYETSRLGTGEGYSTDIVTRNCSSLAQAPVRASLVRSFSAAVIALLTLSGGARALEVNPGDYEQFPVNSTIAVLYFQHGDNSELYAGRARVSQNAKLTSEIGIIRALHVYELMPGVTLDPQFLQPVGGITTAGILAPLGSAAGAGDTIFAAPVKVKLNTEFHDIFAITPYLIVKDGTYSADRNVNLGANRWEGVIQTAYVKHFSPSWSLDLVADAAFFSDNTNFNTGAVRGTLQQDASFELQAYLRYKVDPTMEIAGGLGGRFGGQTSFNGTPQYNSIGTEYARLSAYKFITPTIQVQLEVGRDLTVRAGLKQEDTVQIRIAKIFF